MWGKPGMDRGTLHRFPCRGALRQVAELKSARTLDLEKKLPGHSYGLVKIAYNENCGSRQKRRGQNCKYSCTLQCKTSANPPPCRRRLAPGSGPVSEDHRLGSDREPMMRPAFLSNTPGLFRPIPLSHKPGGSASRLQDHQPAMGDLLRSSGSQRPGTPRRPVRRA